MTIFTNSTKMPSVRYEILGCALMNSLGIAILDTLILKNAIPYYSDDVYVLYELAVHRLTATPWFVVRPIQYLIDLAANYIYLPLWLGASLLCVVGATILSALACERLFERRLPKAGWWILGLADPLLFYLVSQVDIVSQALCNFFFAGMLLVFISEYFRLRGAGSGKLGAESGAVLLNLMAAGLFFTKETGIAAAIIMPAATALMRVKARRLSPIFLISLLLPVGAACAWIWLRLKFLSLLLPDREGARYSLSLTPITWIKNFIITLAMPVTPLPSSFIGFESLRSVWIGAALISVVLFTAFLLRKSWRQPEVALPLLVVAASCAPMIVIRTDELYPSMIAPFAVAIILLFGIEKQRWLSLTYGVLLYTASLGNAIIYCLGADFNPLGLHHLDYSIYGKSYQLDPICPIATTAHVGWDASATHHPPYAYRPDIKGTITCIR